MNAARSHDNFEFVSCEEWKRLTRIRFEAVLADNRAEIREMIDSPNEASRAARQETEEALRIATANMETHKKEHGC